MWKWLHPYAKILAPFAIAASLRVSVS